MIKSSLQLNFDPVCHRTSCHTRVGESSSVTIKNPALKNRPKEGLCVRSVVAARCVYDARSNLTCVLSSSILEVCALFYSLGDLKVYTYVRGLTHAMVPGSLRDTWGLSYPTSLRIAQTKELTDTHRLWLFSEL